VALPRISVALRRLPGALPRIAGALAQLAVGARRVPGPDPHSGAVLDELGLAFDVAVDLCCVELRGVWRAGGLGQLLLAERRRITTLDLVADLVERGRVPPAGSLERGHGLDGLVLHLGLRGLEEELVFLGQGLAQALLGFADRVLGLFGGL